MDILLRKKYKYLLNESVEEVKAELLVVLNSRWNDFSNTIIGRINNDNSFTVKPKMSLGIEILGTIHSFACLEGNLKTENERTIMRVTARPTYFVLLLFYSLSIYGIVSLTTIKSPLIFQPILIVIVFFLAFLYGTIAYSERRLHRQFVKALGINRR